MLLSNLIGLEIYGLMSVVTEWGW